jgi:large subunit ribosomal protein L15
VHPRRPRRRQATRRRELCPCPCFSCASDTVRLVSQHAQELKSPVWITPSRASKSAIQAVEAAGGAVICRYYNELALRDCVKGRTDRKAASPTVAKDLRPSPFFSERSGALTCLVAVWYTNWDNRGYLAKKATAIGLPLYVREQAEEARQVLSRGPQSKRATIGSGPSGVAAAAAAAAAAPSVTVDATAA